MRFLRMNSKLIIFCLILASIGGCKSKGPSAFTSDKAIVDKDKNQILDDVINANINYNKISVKSAVELSFAGSNKSVKSNCYVKLEYNKNIQLSLRAPFINMEVVRLTLTPDSIYFIDRLNKKFAVEGFNKIREDRGLYFNFYNIQSLLTNSLFIQGKEHVTKKDYKNFLVFKESDTYNLSFTDKYNTSCLFRVNSSDRISQTSITNDAYKFKTVWTYSNFVKNDTGDVYPTTINMLVSLKKNVCSLMITYNELDFNNDFTIDNQVPKRYQASSITDILNAYFK